MCSPAPVPQLTEHVCDTKARSCSASADSGCAPLLRYRATSVKTISACSVAVSYKPPMLVTRARSMATMYSATRPLMQLTNVAPGHLKLQKLTVHVLPRVAVWALTIQAQVACRASWLRY